MYLQKVFDKRRNKTYLSVARDYLFVSFSAIL